MSEVPLGLIDSRKTAGLAGLQGPLNLLPQKAKGLADFGEILDFICKTLKTKQLCSHVATVIVTLLFVAKHQTRLRVFQQEPRLRQDKSETCCYRFQDLVGMELPIKHTLQRVGKNYSVWRTTGNSFLIGFVFLNA